VSDRPSLVPERAPPRSPLGLVALGLVALLLLAALSLSGSSTAPQATPPPPDRVVLSTPDPSAQPRELVHLSWETVPGWTYDVHVAGDDLRLLHAQQSVPGGTLALPSEKTRGLPAGSSLMWRVQATRPDGTTLSSPTSVIRLE
jgi:hypothetical protein